MFDREYLIAELLRRGKSADWSLAARQFRCSVDACRSRDVRLEIVPFAGKETPALVQALLDAVADYVDACRGMKGQDLASLQRAATAQGRMHRASRRLIMWAKYGVQAGPD